MDWVVVIQQVVLAVGGVLGSVIAVFGVILVRKLAAKYGVHLEEEENHMIGNALRTGILAAERWAKNGEGKKTGSDKLDYALKIGKSLLRSKLAQRYTEDKLKELIESILEAEKLSDKK